MKTLDTLMITICLTGFSCVCSGQAQPPSSTERLVQQIIEEYARNTEDVPDFAELSDDLLSLHRHPVNLNTAVTQELRQIFFLNEIQIYNLIAFRETYGSFVSLYELTLIDGFDKDVVERIAPFVYVGEDEKKTILSPGKILKYGRSNLIFRYGRMLQVRKGYLYPTDTSRTRPFLGSPDKLYLRYRFSYSNNIQAGFTAEKDPGEPMIQKNHFDTATRQALFRQYSPDYLSGHIQLKNTGIVRSFVVGDYHLRFGQGLTLWSGYTFGKPAEIIDLRKNGLGVTPYGSTDENRFFRGAAGTFVLGDISVSGFYSSNKTDAGIQTDDDERPAGVTSLRETGLHRTTQEIAGKDALTVTAYGGNINYSSTRYRIGFTAYNTGFGDVILPSNRYYKQFDFSGKRNSNAGLDFTYLFKKVFLYGEVSVSKNGGKGVVAGITSTPHPRISTVLLFRNYDKEYQNLFSAAFGESGTNNNEQGLYAGAGIKASKTISLNTYIDYYRFNWLRYNTYRPSSGYEQSVQLHYSGNRRFFAYARLIKEYKEPNCAVPGEHIRVFNKTAKTRFRLHTEYTVTASVSFKNRIEYIGNKNETGYNGIGYLIYHDIVWRHRQEKSTVVFRYALFDTDSYEERLYAYENDVLYSFTVPAFYDKGVRCFLLLKFSPFETVDVWLRMGHTAFAYLNTIGSGNDLIESNCKTDIRMQIKWKL